MRGRRRGACGRSQLPIFSCRSSRVPDRSSCDCVAPSAARPAAARCVGLVNVNPRRAVACQTRGGPTITPGTLANHVFLHCVALPSAGVAACRERRCERSCAACRYDLPRRFLRLPRVRPPPGDGSAPQSPCARLPALHCAWIASRSHYAGMAAGNVCTASSRPRRWAQSSRSLPAASGALGGAQERRGSSRRGDR